MRERKYRIVELNNGTYDVEYKGKGIWNIFHPWHHWGNHTCYDEAYYEMEGLYERNQRAIEEEYGQQIKKIWLVK